ALREEGRGLGRRHLEDFGDVLAREAVLEDLAAEAPALALLAGARDRRHGPEVGVDDPGALAGRARALGVRAEQRRFDAVGLRECLADRVEQARVRGGIGPPGPLDGRLVDGDDTVTRTDITVDQRALARPGDARDDGQYAQRDVDVDVAHVVHVRAADLE